MITSKRLKFVSLVAAACFLSLPQLSRASDDGPEEKKDSTEVKSVMDRDRLLDNFSVRLQKPDTTTDDFLPKVIVKGQARFFMIYRNMQDQYPDQVTPEKDLAFIDYPADGRGNAAGLPLLELNMVAKPSRNMSVDVGYSLTHDYLGVPNDTSRFATVRSNLNFGGELNTDYGLFTLQAGGGVLWSSLSPLTLSNPEYRPDNFDRLPWDWYRNSFDKYNDFYNAEVGLGGESYGNIAVQGFKLLGAGLPYDFGFAAMYGRHNFSIDLNRAQENWPSNMAAFRVDKYVGQHQFGVNYYSQYSGVDQYSGIQDIRTIVTMDAKVNINKTELYLEAGSGMVDNPDHERNWDPALVASANIPEQAFGLPMQIQGYYIGHSVVSNVSSALNSNRTAPNGAFGNDPNYFATVFVNPAQEVGQRANNRFGFSAMSSKKVGDWKFEFGIGLSQEIENIYDTITFQHRANAFSRSRFNPWVQTSGPYQRVQNIFRRSYEFISITDAENDISTDYKKSFASLDFGVNYKTQFMGRDLILKNFMSYSSIQPGLMVPHFTDEAFLRTIYDQIIGFYHLMDKVSLVGFYEIHHARANDRTELSDYNRKPMNQLGHGYGFGIDYDFSDFAGLYYRHRFMYHDDVNFVEDKFKGQESTIELKVFF